MNEEDASMAESRKSLQRYMFYTTRYTNHFASLELEKGLVQTAQSKSLEIKSKCSSLSWIETQYLPNAVQDLLECRRTLMLTYVFGFFYDKTAQMEIFEENQRDLENATEELSEFLERDLDDIQDFHELREKVMNKSIYCQKRRKILQKHISEGNSRNWWILKDGSGTFF